MFGYYKHMLTKINFLFDRCKRDQSVQISSVQILTPISNEELFLLYDGSFTLLETDSGKDS